MGVDHQAERLPRPLRRLDHAELPAHSALRAPALDVKAPKCLVAQGGDDRAGGGLPVHLSDERQVGGGGRAEDERLPFSGVQPGHEGPEAGAVGVEVERHLVAELPVVPGDASDALDQLAPFCAPPVDLVELGAN